MRPRARWTWPAIALALLVPATAAPPASASRVAVVVVPPFPLSSYADRGAVGLLVPGAGSTVSREGALSSLVRGKVVSSLLGGRATGPPLIRLAERPGPITIYVSLPPPGKHHNVRRYPIAIVGGGYRGLLTSTRTRIPGLVSVADVAPSAVALGSGEQPALRWDADDDAPRTLARLDQRLSRAHDARTAALIILVAWTLVLAGAALALRSAVLARAGLLALPAALGVSLALSGAGLSRPWTATAVLAVATGGIALAVASRARLLLPALVAFLVAELATLAVWPEVNALSLIGPHPDGGGRYYGVTNQVETLLLAPILAAAILVPAAWIPAVGALALVLVGWSKAGADGGGVAVILVALLALWALRTGVRPTPARVAAAAAAAVILALSLVGLDAFTGGSSHVTDALGGGPGAVIGDLGHRLNISWKGVTGTVQASVAACAGLVALVGLGLLRPRLAIVGALLAALAVSLLVNDTPTDVLAYGAVVAAALRVWAPLSPATSRSGAAVAPRASRAPPPR